MGRKKPDQGMRNCLGVLCMDKEDRKFKSKSPANRQCDACLAAGEGFSIKGLSRIGIPIDGLEFL